MSYLLDSHTIIWFSLEPQKLSKTTGTILEDSGNEIFVSHVSFWEISIKHALGKIDLHGGDSLDLLQWCKKEGLKILFLSDNDVGTFHKLPRVLHKDPFDRMLVWQSINRHLTLISKDPSLDAYLPYGLKITW